MDSSTWVNYWRRSRTPDAELLDGLLRAGEVDTADLILFEVLSGFDDDLQQARVRREMLRLNVHELLNRDRSLRAAAHYRQLRKRGITVRKTVDCLIATYCIETGTELLHSDRDFDPFEQHLGLRVARQS